MSGLSKMSNTAEIIASELSLSDQLDDLDPKLLKVMKLTTSHLASKRPTAREVLLILNEDYKSIIENKFNIFDFYDNFNFTTYPDLTHLIKVKNNRESEREMKILREFRTRIYFYYGNCREETWTGMPRQTEIN
jgi:hypothetical protein